MNMITQQNPASSIKKRLITLSTFLSLIFFSLTATAAIPVEGKTYFTQHNLMYEKNRHVTTNYWRGELLPINSKVDVLKIGRKKMTLKYKGQVITILNVPKHTKKSTIEIAERMLSTSPVKVSGKFAKSIKFGEMRLGMTKKQVLQARGYPPGHKTISIESDVWTYWSSKFVQRRLIFENNRLTQGRGLR